MAYALFELGNKHLKPFYSYVDAREEISSRRPAHGGGLDIREELPGIFWLTYFSESYVKFFGKERFSALPTQIAPWNGIMIGLSDAPLPIGDKRRREAEAILGGNSFVSGAGVKRRGVTAIDLTTLAASAS